MTMRSDRRTLTALAAAVLTVQACSSESPEGETVEMGHETLASLLAAADNLSTVSEVMGEAGLAQVFDGAAAYTFFPPQNAAFEALGDTGEALRAPEQRAAMVTILRDHIVPGYLTPDDIENAIALDDDKNVEMRTMGDGMLTFTTANDVITVTAEDGASAHFSGETLRASNGVAIPVDGLLRDVAATTPRE